MVHRGHGGKKMNINFYALAQIKACKHRLTSQQYKTLQGQILAGDSDGALRGLKRILRKDNRNFK